MKKILFPAAMLLIMASCSGHSEADARHIQEAHAEAREMFDEMKNTHAVETASSDSSAAQASQKQAVVVQADSVKK